MLDLKQGECELKYKSCRRKIVYPGIETGNIVYAEVEVSKKDFPQLTQMSLRRLQDVLKRSRRLTTKQDVVATSEKRHRIYDVLKTSDLCRIEDD